MCRIDVNQARLGVTPARLASAWEHRTAHMDRLDSTDGDSPMAALPSCAAVHVARTRSPRFIDAIPLHPRRVGAPARLGRKRYSVAPVARRDVAARPSSNACRLWAAWVSFARPRIWSTSAAAMP